MMYVCELCKIHCADYDDLADHQWRTHPETVCRCGHVYAEHGGVFVGTCRRCECDVFTPGPASAPLTCAQLEARLDELGGTLNAACVNHVWSAVLTRDGVPVATARADSLVHALQRVVAMADEVAGG